MRRSSCPRDITIDATVAPIFGQFGPNSNKRRIKGCLSPEVNAGWHAKDPDRRDKIDAKTAHKDRTQYTFGYDVHLALATGPGVGVDFPALILGLSADRPGQAPGLNAATILQSIDALGLPKGLVTVDLGYSQLLAENFAMYVRALGYGLNIMYKQDDLGLQADYEGALLVDGTWFGACLEPQYIDLSRDHAAGLVPDEVYRARLAERQKYALRIIGPSDNGEGLVTQCPAQGIGCAMNCPLPNRAKASRHSKKPGTRGRPAKKRQNVRESQLPDTLQAICSNKTKTTIPMSVGVRHRQELPLGLPEWTAAYARRRNHIEGHNRVLKDGVAAALANPDHRRYRGLGTQNLALVAKAVGANIQAILALLRDITDRPSPAPDRGGRPATTTLADFRREPYDLPLRIAGKPKKEPSGKPKKPSPPGKPAKAA